MTTRDESAWVKLLRTQAAVAPKLSKKLSQAGLPSSWYDILMVINAAPEQRLTMTQLGQRAVLSREQCSRIVAELIKAGLVTRLRHPDDNRSSYAQITESGINRLTTTTPIYSAALAEHFGKHLTSQELEILDDSLGRIATAEEQ